ncbi:MAG: DUF362 domain-containing protein [Eggerthellaceae bacterium]|jgi:uncharacterized protein (DUF362 family)/NAD-dependent dihydropyrimidine dehydrogenase PreA subunit
MAIPASESTVALVPCASYDQDLVDEAVATAFGLVQGTSPLELPANGKILLKPNLLWGAEPERAVTTHPTVFRAAIRTLRAAGYENLSFGDSPSRGSSHQAAERSALLDVARAEGIPEEDFSQSVRVDYPAGHVARSFTLCKPVLDADAIVSLCKMKTHALERITGAVKNSYGFVHGGSKAAGHAAYPNADRFGAMLVDLNKCLRPALFIMDGIVAMEGNGPASGDPVAMKVILASTDPVALDTVFCALVNLDPNLVATNTFGQAYGLGTCRPDRIRLVTPDGPMTLEDAAERFGNPSFKVERRDVESNMGRALERSTRIFSRKPHIDAARCRKCGICIDTCPVEGKALSWANGHDRPPVYDYRRCIRCFCCQEVCPAQAITARRGL